VPPALHHIIARGIERKRIFTDGVDRDNFLNRPGNILTETQTACFSYALIPNHYLLLRTGTTSIFGISGIDILPKADLRLFQNQKAPRNMS